MNNKEIVIKAMTELFVNLDVSALERYWGGNPYLQHNPDLADGHDTLRSLVKSLNPETFSYKMGHIIAEGDIVMAHGRYIGWSDKPVIVVDIFRFENGKIVEHWDVVQSEVPSDKTKSGRSMLTGE